MALRRVRPRAKAEPAERMEIEEISSEEAAVEAPRGSAEPPRGSARAPRRATEATAEMPHRLGDNRLRLSPEQQSMVLSCNWETPYMSGPDQWQGALPLRHSRRSAPDVLRAQREMRPTVLGHGPPGQTPRSGTPRRLFYRPSGIALNRDMCHWRDSLRSCRTRRWRHQCL